MYALVGNNTFTTLPIRILVENLFIFKENRCVLSMRKLYSCVSTVNRKSITKKYLVIICCINICKIKNYSNNYKAKMNNQYCKVGFRLFQLKELKNFSLIQFFSLNYMLEHTHNYKPVMKKKINV